jgi:hypothetical protein
MAQVVRSPYEGMWHVLQMFGYVPGEHATGPSREIT